MNNKFKIVFFTLFFALLGSAFLKQDLITATLFSSIAILFLMSGPEKEENILWLTIFSILAMSLIGLIIFVIQHSLEHYWYLPYVLSSLLLVYWGLIGSKENNGVVLFLQNTRPLQRVGIGFLLLYPIAGLLTTSLNGAVDHMNGLALGLGLLASNKWVKVRLISGKAKNSS
ncbi:hypothetical protein D9981_20370 [Pseudoalteromonas phenolica O-BC30]|uniref:Uncharacterized protein n=2 Tax=Pseudoalteromonas phenolica TaxID=161398 RepID=A0A0S2JX30_9GAMM|nr:hypothetical protein PP2015_144 [Pseudoalteromonas phenolica]MBE0354813.1 hypothetical protein [Pseudoalteromonas phenolica O-BC30]RXE93474.1 hypothetical protein D9981_20370 [Pseudoalteromonas phenolica O-BC30]